METLYELSESAGAPVKAGSRWLVTIAKPGQGSTGYYSEDTLRKTGPTAFPPGTKAFFTHESRDVRDMVGVYEEGAFWNDEVGELQALLTPFPRYRTVLDEAGKNIEASVHVTATKDMRSGHVKELRYHRSNTVDLVAFAGLEGSGLKYQVESLFTAASAVGDEGKEEKNMDEAKVVALFEALTSKVETISARFDTFVTESKVVKEGVANEAAVEAAVKTRLDEALESYAAGEKSIDDADLLDVQREALKAEARKGNDVTQALADAVAVVVQAKEAFTPDPKGTPRAKLIVATEDDKSQSKTDFRVGRWNR